ncbi:IPT/TIG domain-containing protein [Anditalea andensis]|uniref:IPT/TIG domain-containing protein n=1 Tax=Anditalea andensis TaxID=1048983 RepID=A0A074KXW4_9BACT|nr:hypothetical protein EL17_15650 [Anditalea andensis]
MCYFFALTNCNIKEEPILGRFKIEGISPVHAIPGEEIRILGEGFGTNIQSYIPKLGNRNIEVKIVEDSLLILQIPADFIIGNYILSLNRDGYREYSKWTITENQLPRINCLTQIAANRLEVSVFQHFPFFWFPVCVLQIFVW